MQLKHYRRPTVQEALRAAKLELGADAVVLSTELVSMRGWRGWLGVREVRVTAAVDRQVSADRPPAPRRRPVEVAPVIQDPVVAQLVASGLDPELAVAAARALPPSDRRSASPTAVRRALGGTLAALVADDEEYERAEIFIGPPGAGKTTTIAKIAARERAGRGRTLGMIAADGFRAGAVEQLRLYATIVGSPFRIARNAEELDTALTASRQPVLVDTAGRSPREPGICDVLQLVGRRRRVRTHLVMAADTSPKSALRILDAYTEAKPDRLVITKLDEAESISPLISVLRDCGLPVSYLCAGQRVPEDLERATPLLLASAVLGDAAPSTETWS